MHGDATNRPTKINFSPTAISPDEFRLATQKSLLPCGVDMPVARLLLAEYMAEREEVSEKPAHRKPAQTAARRITSAPRKKAVAK